MPEGADTPLTPTGPGVNPGALSIEQAARLFSSIRRRSIDPEVIRGDLEAGAPCNPDGTLNLVNYTAWLVAQRTHAR